MITRDLRVSTKQQPPDPGDLQDGLLSGQVRFIRLIGAGGMGQVWEAASDDLPGQRFAVKVIAAAYATDPGTVSRFFGEARAAGAIDDPNIVTVYGTGRTHDGRPALVMPYIEGQSLADMCDERGPLPLDAVGKIMLQLASALRAAHGASIVHRDIKPQNAMVMSRRWGREWFVILVDFGICKFHDAELAGQIRTNTNQYIGTPGFSAPEQILGKPVSAKADIYALGVLAYRILCGRMPYSGDSAMAVMTQQCDPNASFPEPRYWRRDIPREWNDVICICMERDPARRPTAPEVGRWIAAGMQNGASMLTSLAPQIAAETKAPASAATISSDVPTALAQIQALSRRRVSRLAQVPSLAVAAIVGVVATAAAFELAGSPRTTDPRAELQASAVASREPSPQAPTPPTNDGDRSSTGSAMSPADVTTTSGSAANPTVDHQRPPGSPEDNFGSREGAGMVRTASSPPSDGSRPRLPSVGGSESARPRRATGTLEIRAKTWADCFLSDGGAEVSIGTAPTTVPDIPVGRHRVRCRNPGQNKDETVTVNIDATKIAIIEKDW